MAPLLPPGNADSTGIAAKRSIGRALSRAYTARLRPAGSGLDAARWEQDTDLEAGTEAQVRRVVQYARWYILCMLTHEHHSAMA